MARGREKRKGAPRRLSRDPANVRRRCRRIRDKRFQTAAHHLDSVERYASEVRIDADALGHQWECPDVTEVEMAVESLRELEFHAGRAASDLEDAAIAMQEIEKTGVDQ